MGYQYNMTTISAINSSNISLDLSDSLLYIKNTLNFILEENQKFVDIIRRSMINSNEIIHNTSDFIEFSKLYSFVFDILNSDYFNNFLKKFNLEILFINMVDLNISDKEITTNLISHQSLSEKMKYFLNIISKNHFTLQTLINNM